ncbi:hypothetical protein ACFW9D_06125 [Streptomyces sp. NPDC059524]|uniref:Rv1733c family protein n=1 Tax=Streptomyces sp. NPDC059524 TaxID=3346856 RepID=UPI0036A43D31
MGDVRRRLRWWGRGPLTRDCDVFEGWVVLVAWILAVLGGALAGVLAGTATEASLSRQRAERLELSAVVVKEAPRPQIMQPGGGGTRATVRWTAPDGIEHTGTAKVAAGTAAGAHVTVWTDREGDRLAPPVNPAESLFGGAMAGLLAAGGTAVVVGAGTKGVRLLVERRRLAGWDAEWVQADARWRRTAG